jgi:hypothetical protein
MPVVHAMCMSFHAKSSFLITSHLIPATGPGVPDVLVWHARRWFGEEEHGGVESDGSIFFLLLQMRFSG